MWALEGTEVLGSLLSPGVVVGNTSVVSLVAVAPEVVHLLIAEHITLADAALFLDSLCDPIKPMLTLVPRDAYKPLHQLCVLGHDLHWLIFDSYLPFSLELLDEFEDFVRDLGVNHVEEVIALRNPISFHIGEVYSDVSLVLYLRPDSLRTELLVLGNLGKNYHMKLVEYIVHEPDLCM